MSFSTAGSVRYRSTRWKSGWGWLVPIAATAVSRCCSTWEWFPLSRKVGWPLPRCAWHTQPYSSTTEGWPYVMNAIRFQDCLSSIGTSPILRTVLIPGSSALRCCWACFFFVGCIQRLLRQPQWFMNHVETFLVPCNRHSSSVHIWFLFLSSPCKRHIS